MQPDPAPEEVSKAAKATKQPFPCDGYAYLVHDAQAQLYRFNPEDGGSFEVRWSDRHTGPINAIGYRFLDGYLYGWGKNEQRLVRISNEGTASEAVEVLTDVPQPAELGFITGDVHEDRLYLFSGSAKVYSISLENLGPTSQWEMQQLTVLEGNGITTSEFKPDDVAFVPEMSATMAFGVRGNILVQFDLAGGSIMSRGAVSFSGGFGGAYAEEGTTNLFVSKNSNGDLYRVNVANPADWELVASSGIQTDTNDGAHCAEAPMGKFDIHYNNHRENGSSSAVVRAQIEGDSGAMKTIGDPIGVSYAAHFNESSSEMTTNGVEPGSTKQIGFDVDGTFVDCGRHEMTGHMLFSVFNNAGVWECRNEGGTFIQIHNASDVVVNPYFDSAKTPYPGAADSDYGYLESDHVKVYFPGDGFLDATSIDIHEGDVIDEVSAYTPFEVEVYNTCATKFPFDQAYYFRVIDKSPVGVTCLDFS